jgi:hypothetical protein
MVLSAMAMAQTYSTHSFGYLGGQTDAVLSAEQSINFNYSGGNVIASDQFNTLLLDEAQAMVGFPSMIPYFPTVFAQDPSISKGYFSDYVQLQWNILSQQDRISIIKIFRKPLASEGDSVLIATISADNFSYRDEFAEKSVLYKYTVFASGIADELRLPFINYIEGVGFAFPFGTAAGRITYEGGTAVQDVQILAEADGDLGGKSLLLNGTDAYLSLNHQATATELELSTGFSLQMWTQYKGTTKGTLFSKGSQYELAYEQGNLIFTVGGTILTMPYTHPVDSFFHVTAVFDAINGLSLYVRENDLAIDSASVANSTALPVASTESIYFGKRNDDVNYYDGYLDELRLWNAPLTFEQAKANYSSYLTGSEANLSGYWKLNSGIGEGFFDFSREGFSFHENHGEVFRGAWSTVIPYQSQLAYRGVTDANGNYVVRGFPYGTAGSQYTFTPIFGVHSFEPVQQLRFVGDGSSIHNGIDFDDVSSFPVTGTIAYHHSAFPVEGVSILIDGNPAINQEGGLILSDNLGQFAIDVPIGAHSLKLSKTGHNFEDDGRFPPATVAVEIPTYNFQQPLPGLTFIDNSVVKFVGKVVGGPIEAEKPRGFGLSTNNIGVAQINISSEKGYDITTSDSTIVYDERNIVSGTKFSTKFVTVYPDTLTGEFVTYLPPEKYVITGVTAGDYVFGTEHNVSLNMENSFEQTDSHDELVMEMLENGEPVPGYNPVDSTLYDYFTIETILDTTYVYGGRDFTFEKEKDFILRVQPDIAVLNQEGLELFGESTYFYEDELREDEITLIDAGNNYTFGQPVFFQQSRYNMFISVFEEYTNSYTSETDQVAVKDGNIEIVNDFGINKEIETLPLNDKGKATYSFGAGFPELNKNVVDGTLSFTRPFSLTAITGQSADIRTTWRESDPLRGIVFGGVPEGNNFVTTGPNQIVTILRDPPGSNSFATLEEGRSTTSTVSWGTEITSTSSVTASVDLGAKVTAWAGVGGGTIVETELINDIDLGLELSSSFTANGEIVNTVTNTKAWSTSRDPNFVNASGDVFVGHSTNIVYGAAVSLQPIPITDIECATGDCDGLQNGDFQLGPRTGLRLNPEFGTMFIYTQSHIENVLIPNLVEIRNSLLSYSSDPGSVVADTEVIYLSLVATDDERFGSANYSMTHWGDAASTDMGIGPSYNILIPASFDPTMVTDTIGYFNKQIEGWVKILEHNERVKVNAQLSENISFDGGTNFVSSEQVESSSTYAFDFNVGITASIATDIGVSALGMGVEVNTSQSIKMGGNAGGGFGETNSTTYGYTLADGSNAGSNADYYTVDVKTPTDGYGPVFVTRAGVSSCPYEGQDVTKYFEPGQHVLNFATVQVEKPEITIVNPLVANVPSNRQAEITLELKNNTESDADIIYNLNVNDQSNFSGAILAIDGSVLTGDGRGFLVPAGTSVSKILRISKGSEDVNDYENIELKLSSRCDNKISDTQSFSVFFQPGCSDISLTSPVDQWVVNTNSVPEKTQNIIFDNYDLQNSQFRYVKFQYKASSSSQWLTNMLFYNPLLVTQVEYDGLDEPKAWLAETGSTTFPWDMSGLPDRAYDVQVVSVCQINASETAETPSETHSGRKDTNRPIAFGAPQPADGILSANDEIMIQFDETIEAGLLTPFNFSVRAVLNSADIRHSASVNFDGINDYVRIEDGLNLSNRSFTIEMWLKRENFTKEQVLYSKGYAAGNIFEFGFTSNNNFFINTGGEITTSVNTYEDIAWGHYAVVYDAAVNQVHVYKNDEYVLEQLDITTPFTGEGSIVLGKSQITNDRSLEGNIHDFRIWTKARKLDDIFTKMSQTLSGSEVGLTGYWPMDEAFGTKAFDLARFRHATLFADWEVSPKGKAYAFDGVDDYLELNTGSTIIVTPEMDYTIEFWFKGTPNQTNAVLFSSGKGDGTDVFNDPVNSLSIGFDGSGTLYYINNGVKMEVDDANYLDDNWHHIAFTLLRQSNANLLVDGEQKVTITSADFGGLSGANMWIGARGFKVSSGTTVFDQHFAGNIDEFRVWNLGKKSTEINLDRNSRLIGDEIGLIGYYPFEYYETVTGIKIMNPTIEDQWQNPYGANAGTATSAGGADFSDDTPNIKDARPVDKVDFDWVVNDDKIIITPASTFTALIEQTVLEITVQNVEDLFENRLASPVTWTAFIDRNQLKWNTDQITAKKQVYEDYTFTVDVVNHGGTEANYTIDNLPLWLQASPASGALAPVSSETITFTVDAGLNTGNYLEDIYLSSNFGYDEKLSIDLQVFSPAPKWATNPSDFQFSMNLVAQLEIADVISSDLNDRVAAFVNDTIRGNANLIYLKELDLYEVFLDIYSNVESGEVVELRVWDADKGIEYRHALPAISFSSNTIIGTPVSPEKIVAGDVIVQEVQFTKGWNWTSVNVASSSLTDINALMSEVTAHTGDQIKGIDKFDIYTDGFGWSGTLSGAGGIENGAMYLFKLSNPGDIEVIGTRADPATTVDINSGWNWLGFIPRFNMKLDEAFAFFNPTSGDIIKSQFAFAVYDETLGWTGSLNNLEPGKGYLYNSAIDGTFQYPESSSLTSGRSENSENAISNFKGIDRHKYPHTMSIVAELDLPNVDNYEIAVYDGEEIRGVMEPTIMAEDQVLYFLTIYGDSDQDELTIRAIDMDSNEETLLDQKIVFNSNKPAGSLKSPFQLTGLSSSEIDELLKQINIYPNPFTNELAVVIPRTSDVAPKMVLTNMIGKVITEFEVHSANGGAWNANIESSQVRLNNGMYLVKIYSGGVVKSFKVIKQN